MSILLAGWLLSVHDYHVSQAPYLIIENISLVQFFSIVNKSFHDYNFSLLSDGSTLYSLVSLSSDQLT